MKNQAYRMTMLFDFYGELLTDRQKEFFDLYYNEDLSLAEIAENYGISRQGVRDVIVRAEGIMTEMEDKTGIIKRFHLMQKQLSSASESLDKIISINSEKYFDRELDTLAREAKETIEQMKQE
ncbi:MAG: YlxM family DNA-binding protein [Oscillospiraceae bacterium]